MPACRAMRCFAPNPSSACVRRSSPSSACVRRACHPNAHLQHHHAHRCAVVHLGHREPQHAGPGTVAAITAVLPALQSEDPRYPRWRIIQRAYHVLRPAKSGSTESSLIEKSHHDPVYDVFWITSKTGNQCASVSTDGQMLWWDIRKLSQPVDTVVLNTDAKGGGMVLGGSSMEYNSEAGPMKYLVGTEQGIVMQINLRNRKQNNGVAVFDTGPGKHHGPIYAIQRNPTHNKFFMTVGDWTARIWTEDLKTPIMTTKYHSAYLTSGCWSPTRAGVFFVTRMDGVVDIWDYFYRQNEVAYSHKVGDTDLSCIAVSNQGGKYVAVGDTMGTVSLLELCDSLAAPQTNEKMAISNMFDREMKQEKNLEARERDLKRAKAQEAETREKEAAEKKDGKDDKMEELLRKVDADFLAMIKEAEDDESKQTEATGMEDDK